MTQSSLAAVAGVAETLLGPDVLASLPANGAGAPWTCRCEAVVWSDRGTRAANAALPPAIGHGAKVLGVIGGMVRYLDTPVGEYNEVLGTVGFRHGRSVRGSVLFMAVDSPVSLIGGRTNWGMPKTLARFQGNFCNFEANLDGRKTAAARMSAEGTVGPPWSVSATARALGPTVPMVSSFTVLQQFADGQVRSSWLKAKGRARPALVTVNVESEGTLPDWLRGGRRLGAIVESMTFTLAEPVTP